MHEGGSLRDAGSEPFVQACLLLLLHEQPGTRRALRRRMRAFHLGEATAVAHAVDALVRAGEARRPWPWSYRLTDMGEARLHAWAGELRILHDALHEPGDDQAG